MLFGFLGKGCPSPCCTPAGPCANILFLKKNLGLGWWGPNPAVEATAGRRSQCNPARCASRGRRGSFFDQMRWFFVKKKHINFCAPVVLRAHCVLHLCAHTPLHPFAPVPCYPNTLVPLRPGGPPPHAACRRAPSPLGHPSPLGVHVPVCPCVPAPFCPCTPVPPCAFHLAPLHPCRPMPVWAGAPAPYTPAPLRILHPPRLVGVARHG